MSDILDITKSEYIDILKNKRKHYHLKLMLMHYLKELNI